MPILDLKTSAILGLVLHGALALVMLQTYLTRKTYPGFRSWTLGLICWALASALFFFRDQVGIAASVLLSNILYFLFSILLYSGLARFYNFDLRRRLLAVTIGVAALSLGGLYWNLLAVDDVTMRVFFSSAGMGTILGIASLAPLAVPQGRRQAIQLGISLGLGGDALLFVLRAQDALLSPWNPDFLAQDTYLKLIVIFGLFVLVLTVCGFISLMHARLEEELLQAQSELKRQAGTDALTGIRNRRSFMENALHGVAQARRYNQKLSLILFDLDHFKSINDTHGHMTGDRVLSGVARACQSAVREVDTFGRWGGEEFAVLMFQTDLDGARQTGERLRELLRGLRPLGDMGVMITASFGVAELGDEGFDEMMARADQCLYRAKREGRDKVCLAA